MGCFWKERPFPVENGEEIAKEIAEACCVSLTMARLMVKRGCVDVPSAMTYLEPDWEDLGDPFDLPDMQEAVVRVMRARDQGETVCICGDYDADGIIATSILFNYFKVIGLHVIYRVPNRLVDGYGMNVRQLREAIDEGSTLVITVDNGISAFEEVDFLRNQEIDLIITDHHECQKTIPQCVAVIDAKRADTHYCFPSLCGAGIAFKFVQALDVTLGFTTDLRAYIEMAALATVADVVPLKFENRVIVSLGLRSINLDVQSKGLAALVSVSELDTSVTATHMGFVLAPKLNAAGRLGEAEKSIELFITDEDQERFEIAKKLTQINEKRQEIEWAIFEMAKKIVESEKSYTRHFLLVSHPNWHPGVIGIVASRLLELWYRPTIVVSILESGLAVGSCRSIPGVDIFDALSSCGNLFTSFGGHEQAAGFSLPAVRLPDLCAALETYGESKNVRQFHTKTYRYDFSLQTEEIGSLYDEIQSIEPVGYGNPGVVFKIRVDTPVGLRRIGKGKEHLCFLVDGFKCLGFGMGDCCNAVALGGGAALVKLKQNAFNGNIAIEGVIQDFKANPLEDHMSAWEIVQCLLSRNEEQIRILPIWFFQDHEILIDREQCKKVYRCFHCEKITKFGFDELKDRCRPMNSFQLLVVLNVLKQCSLIEFKLKQGEVFGRKCKIIEKRDIQKAPLMIQLKKHMKDQQGQTPVCG